MITLNRTTVISLAAASSVAVLAVAGVSVAQAHRTVTVNLDGVSSVVKGFPVTTADVLAMGNIELGEHDLVEPALDEKVRPGQEISVRSAAPYHLSDDQSANVVWSPGGSVEDVLSDVTASEGRAANYSLTVSRSQTRQPLPVVEKSVTSAVVVDGTPINVELSGGETLDEIIDLAKIELSPLDNVRFVSEDGVPQVHVKTVTRGTRTETQEIAAPVEEREDATLAKGETRVEQEGAPGTLTVSIYEQTRGGEILVSTVTGEERTAEPTPRVVLVGTKEAAQQTVRASAPADSGAPAASFGGDAWAALAQCESGGNPAANTGNGYYGMYQFSAGTWASVGGSGLPSDASAEEQTMRAQMLQQRSGWGQWPGCSSSIGLR